MASFIKKSFYCSLGIIALVFLLGVCFLWWYASHQAEPLLRPTNPAYTHDDSFEKKYPNLKMESFQFKGWDGTEIPAVIVQSSGQPTRQMNRWRQLLGEQDYRSINYADYVLVSVEWDHGIQSALPLAEALAAAGLKCVLWESRGIDQAREYCTHGLRESRDIPELINALEKREPEASLVVLALGRGYGASLLLQAVSIEPRLSALISIDAYASLSESLKRTITGSSALAKGKMWLIDRRLNSTVGYEIFDVAPVESIIEMNRETPLLLMNLSPQSEIVTLDDALNLYRQSPSEVKEVWTLRAPSDREDTRVVNYSYRSGDELVKLTLDVQLKDSEEMAYASMISWVDEMMARLILEKNIAPELHERTSAAERR